MCGSFYEEIKVEARGFSPPKSRAWGGMPSTFLGLPSAWLVSKPMAGRRDLGTNAQETEIHLQRATAQTLTMADRARRGVHKSNSRARPHEPNGIAHSTRRSQKQLVIAPYRALAPPTTVATCAHPHAHSCNARSPRVALSQNGLNQNGIEPKWHLNQNPGTASC